MKNACQQNGHLKGNCKTGQSFISILPTYLLYRHGHACADIQLHNADSAGLARTCIPALQAESATQVQQLTPFAFAIVR